MFLVNMIWNGTCNNEKWLNLAHLPSDFMFLCIPGLVSALLLLTHCSRPQTTTNINICVKLTCLINLVLWVRLSLNAEFDILSKIKLSKNIEVALVIYFLDKIFLMQTLHTLGLTRTGTETCCKPHGNLWFQGTNVGEYFEKNLEIKPNSKPACRLQ